MRRGVPRRGLGGSVLYDRSPVAAGDPDGGGAGLARASRLVWFDTGAVITPAVIILVFPWGGRINAFTRRPVRYRLWTWVSAMNPRQGRFAWALLVWVALTDLYIRLDAATVLHDIRFF